MHQMTPIAYNIHEDPIAWTYRDHDIHWLYDCEAGHGNFTAIVNGDVVEHADDMVVRNAIDDHEASL